MKTPMLIAGLVAIGFAGIATKPSPAPPPGMTPAQEWTTVFSDHVLTPLIERLKDVEANCRRDFFVNCYKTVNVATVTAENGVGWIDRHPASACIQSAAGDLRDVYQAHVDALRLQRRTIEAGLNGLSLDLLLANQDMASERMAQATAALARIRPKFFCRSQGLQMKLATSLATISLATGLITGHQSLTWVGISLWAIAAFKTALG